MIQSSFRFQCRFDFVHRRNANVTDIRPLTVILVRWPLQRLPTIDPYHPSSPNSIVHSESGENRIKIKEELKCIENADRFGKQIIGIHRAPRLSPVERWADMGIGHMCGTLRTLLFLVFDLFLMLVCVCPIEWAPISKAGIPAQLVTEVDAPRRDKRTLCDSLQTHNRVIDQLNAKHEQIKRKQIICDRRTKCTRNGRRRHIAHAGPVVQWNGKTRN